MTKIVYNGKELAEALIKGSFEDTPESTVLEGLVKTSENKDSVAFTISGCDAWVDIPTDMIQSAEYLGIHRCRDHSHPKVKFTLHEPMNAQHDYIIRMSKDEMPPSKAFWSVTVYDAINGFFIPNEGKKYSVGENAGMKLNDEGGIEIYVSAEKPEGVPAENWLPIVRKDEGLDMVMRIYAPDLEKMKTWEAPKADKIK